MNYHILSCEQIKRFEEDGYLVVENLFSPAEVQRILETAQIDPQLKADTKANQNYDDGEEGLDTILAYRPYLSQDAYSAMAYSRRLIEPLEQLLKGEVFHFYHIIMQKDPGTGGWQYHQDYGYHYRQFLYPDYISCMVALEPAVRENGCIRVYKGSNRLGRIDHCSSGVQLIADPGRLDIVARHMEEVHCELAAGSVLYFHGNTLHASDPNLSCQGRWSLVGSYAVVSNVWTVSEALNSQNPYPEKLDDEQFEAAVRRYWEDVKHNPVAVGDH